MIKVTNKSTSLTSFHGSTVKATVNQLKQLFNKPQYTGHVEDKVQNEWELEVDEHVFTLYSWKEYRDYGDDELIEWHIGGHHKAITDNAMYQIERMLDKVK